MKKCTVTVASNMSDETYGYLCGKTRERFGSDIEFSRITDDSIIGGFILDLNGYIFDLSIASQLEAMNKHLREE